MPIDIRAAVSCSLGPVISGGIDEDSVIQTGLARTTGSVLISGLITPAIGTVVTVSYARAGVSWQINRSLRVLSSFADPFKRTTSVKLGCKLTYLQDLKEPINWTALNDPSNALTAEDARIITLPIRAQAIAEQCLTKLGITGSFSLSNSFSIASFDLSAGYVDVLGRLLESECLCGWLDASDVLQVVNLDQAGGTGPVIDSSQLVELSEIGSGQLPGEAVTVSYSTLKLKPNVSTGEDSVKVRNWERSDSIGFPVLVSIADPKAADEARFYNYYYIPRTITISNYDIWDRLVSRTSESYSILAEVAPSFVAHIGGMNGNAICKTVSITTVDYTIPAGTRPKPDDYDKVEKETQISHEPYVKLIGSTEVYSAFGDADIAFNWNNSPTNLFLASRTETANEVIKDNLGADVSKTTTHRWEAYGYTQRGQQQISAVLSNVDLFDGEAPNVISNGVAEAVIANSAEQLVYQGFSEEINIGREANLQRRPNAADRTNAGLGGKTVESSSELSLAMGSATAQRRIEFSLPLAPDDTFIKVGSSYTSTPSDAPQKAQRYGLVQNRLLLGNRSGVGIQARPNVLPATPFAPFVIRSGGVSALYRTNGLSWTFDAQGIVLSCDALFWGGVGGSGPIWFPVAPGITTLPAAPGTTTVNILDGSGNVIGSYQQMAVSAVVPVWNETRKYNALLRLRAKVTSLPYPLQVVKQTSIRTRLRVTVKTGTLIDVPAARVVVAGQVPSIFTTTAIQVPAVRVVIAAQVPTIQSSAIVEPPAARVVIAAAVPSVKAPYDPYEEDNKLLLPFIGANNSTTITDYSPLAHTVTANDNAEISTDESIFDGSSLYLDGSSTSYLTIPASSGFTFSTAFTLETWLYLPVTPSGSYAAIIDTRTPTSTFGQEAILLAVDSSRKLKLFRGPLTDLESSVNAIPLTTWTHAAVCWDGTTLSLYAAGSRLATVSDSNARTQNGPAYIGRVRDSAHAAFNGYLSYMRLSAVCRYSGSSYTVPGKFSL